MKAILLDVLSDVVLIVVIFYLQDDAIGSDGIFIFILKTKILISKNKKCNQF